MTDSSQRNLVEIGIIKRPFGIKGELKFKQHSSAIGNIYRTTNIWIKSKSFQLEYVKDNSNQTIIKIKGINNKENASKLSQHELYIAESDLSKLPEGKFYHAEIIGSKVTSSCKTIGILEQIIETGVNEVYVISLNDGKELLVANTPQFIKNFNKEKKILQIIMPEVI